jgi:hypothetical protein
MAGKNLDGARPRVPLWMPLPPASLLWALDRQRQGADWAGMLHLTGSRGHEAFATFDREIAAAAGSALPLPVERLQ